MTTANDATISVEENHIFKDSHLKYKEMELEDLNEVITLYNEYKSNQLVNKILIAGSGRTSLTQEAREVAEPTEYDTLAEAIVVKSLSERIIANFYFSTKKKSYPIKVFTSEKNAIQWLNNL